MGLEKNPNHNDKTLKNRKEYIKIEKDRNHTCNMVVGRKEKSSVTRECWPPYLCANLILYGKEWSEVTSQV